VVFSPLRDEPCYYDLEYDGAMIGWEESSKKALEQKADEWWAKQCDDSFPRMKSGDEHSCDAFILCLGVSTPKFKVGYSYDITVSKLGNGVSGGSHEVSLGFNFACKKKPKNFRKISCPSF
jgi:hypothetical protein